MRKVKIVCTLGPSTDGVKKLVGMIESGMDAARLNFSHGDHKSHEQMVKNVREAAKQTGKAIAVFGDLCGPKIRVGTLLGGEVMLEDGSSVRLVSADIIGKPGVLPHSYKTLALDVNIGEPILIDDGLIKLLVARIDGNDVICNVLVGGIVRDHKGMNLPDSNLSTPALTDKDREDVQFARKIDVDFLALSFVRSPEDIQELREIADGIPILAKIEKPEAVENIDAILDEADGVMVARGDLGVELGHEKVPLVQKRIIKKMRPLAKPVITATQMLESMIHNATPTRAEVSDVANAVLDGTDAVMLSGETSVGKYPLQTVRVMAAIIDEIEKNNVEHERRKNTVSRDKSFSSVIAEAVTAAASEFNLDAIAVYTKSGRSAALMSADRPKTGVIAFTWDNKVMNRLALYWGIKSLNGPMPNNVPSVVEMTERKLLENKLVKPGDTVAITFGMVLDTESFQTDTMKLWKIRKNTQKTLGSSVR